MNARKLWLLLFLGGLCCHAQDAVQRNFPISVASAQAALKKLPGGTSGSLPVLDGFVLPGVHKLEEYKRPFYQCTVHVTQAADGGSLVRVTAKITAWSSDPAHPGYEVLKSNGRIESDLLDRLQAALGVVTGKKSTTEASPPMSSPISSNPDRSPDISAPMPQFPAASAAGKNVATMPLSQDSALDQEARGLEELLRNQAHPTNLVAVKQDQTPLLQEPSSDAKVLFLASSEDEFEILDSNPEWVHVRISGLSRGWLRRSSVELLDGTQPTTALSTSTSNESPTRPSSKVYVVSGEEVGNFPGDWAPLKGKNVKIISVQQTPGTGRITSPEDKLRFAQSMFKNGSEDNKSEGMVLIFDTEDGGLIAATRATLELWKTGALSDQGFWKQCYLDPPEILGAN
ncbi:MAG TPA: SH3 domain-containing protein [Terriglobales bacterium]|nr:SH3 domain-containing protein [Terriglobales bacterium]